MLKDKLLLKDWEQTKVNESFSWIYDRRAIDQEVYKNSKTMEMRSKQRPITKNWRRMNSSGRLKRKIESKLYCSLKSYKRSECMIPSTLNLSLMIWRQTIMESQKSRNGTKLSSQTRKKKHSRRRRRLRKVINMLDQLLVTRLMRLQVN